MKKIITILIFVAACGLLLSSVSAADLQEHDFDGHFSLDVPVNAFYKDANAEGQKYTSNDGQGLIIQYLTPDDLNGASFEDYVNSLGLKDGKIDGNFTVFQDGDKYVVIVNSTDEMYIISDKDLDEAKAIAESADLEGNNMAEDTTNDDSSTNASYDLEKVKMGKVLTIDAPKGSDLNEATFDGFWTVAYTSNTKAAVYYTNDEISNTTIDDAFYKEFMDNVTSQKGVKSSVEGNATIVEGIQNIDGTNAGYVHGDNEMVIIVSNDLGLVKEMVKSIEFTD